MPDSIIKSDNISSLNGGGVGFPDGSVSNPSLKFTNDGDTGLYRIDANKIGISTGGIKVGEFGVGYGGFTGNIIQVVSNGYNTQQSRSSTAYATTGLVCSITPKYSNSKILVLYMIGGCYNPHTSYNGMRFKLFKNTVELPGSYEDIHNYSAYGGGKYTGFYLDSPTTTSLTSYEVYYACREGSATVYVQYASSNSHMVLLEVQQ